MNQEYFTKFSDMAKKAQEPLQALTELNIKTLQSLSYIRPDELINLRKPEQLLEKQVETAISNGHKALDYMQQSFSIMESAMLSLVRETKNKAEDMKQ